MKRTDRWVAALVVPVLCLGFVAESRAELINRGTYDGVVLVYDSVQRITWLGDADWAKTSGFDPDGEMTWGEARTWAGRLTIGGFSDWRLPITSDETCKGAGCTNSEMGHLFDVGGVSSVNPGLFANVQEREYWSSRSDSSDPDLGWHVHFGNGDQGVAGKSDSFIPWAVRDGDVGAEVSIETEPGRVLARSNLGSQGVTPVFDVDGRTLPVGRAGGNAVGWTGRIWYDLADVVPQGFTSDRHGAGTAVTSSWNRLSPKTSPTTPSSAIEPGTIAYSSDPSSPTA
ncbi:MAG: DUF1566 domain-containing protein [Ilumatobacter sp.]|nr:DUF1566 domain-containing protein [Ilumatobacter sp.]